MIQKIFTMVLLLCSIIVCGQDGQDTYRIGKIHTSAPIVHTTNFPTTQIFSLANLNNRTKDLARSGSYRLTYSDTYAPLSINNSNPMIRIRASTVEVDLNGMEIVCNNNSGAGFVGMEIGLNPNETGTQVTNVVIKNGALRGFDCGILIHAGVKNVMLENVQIINSSIGIVCMGQSGSFYEDSVVSVILDGVRIIGHGADMQTALVNLKSLVETTYNYGGNSFMPLRTDPFNSDTVDVHTYFGILANYTSDLFIINSCVQGIGYGGYDEGNGGRTQGIGIAIRNCARVGLKSSFVEKSVSQIKSVGLQVEATNDIEMQESQFGNNVSQTQALGLELFSAGSPTYIVESMKIYDCEFSLNYADDIAMGANISKIRDLDIQRSAFNRNHGKKTCYGMYSSKINFANIIDTTFCANFADNASITASDGVLAAGIYLKDIDGGTRDIESITLDHVQASSNVGTNSGRGIYINGGNSIILSHVNCCLNQGTSLRSSEATDLIGSTTEVAGYDQSTSVISKHLGALTSTGGVGLWLENVSNCMCDDVATVYNQGVRATGILGRNCIDCTFKHCNTSSQQATGSCFSSSLANQSPTALNIVPVQRQLLYGGGTVATLSSKYATDKFLQAMDTVKTNQLAATSNTYANFKTITSAIALLQAGVARYRLWGTAVGLHLHNSSGCFIDGHKALRNSSAKDSAMGIAFTGEVQACTIINSDMSYNSGWTDSVRTHSTEQSSYTFNLTEVYPFWDMLANPGGVSGQPPIVDGTWGYASSTTDTGLYYNAGVFSAQGEFIKIRLDGSTYSIVNPVGPTTIGCLVGDAALDVLVQGNLIQGNNGNSGQAYGILLDVGFAVVMQENRVYSTSTNSYGYSYGIADINAHSASVQLSNEASGNRSGAYYNANYMILYNPSDVTETLTFQSLQAYNGDLSSAAAIAQGKSNLEVNYIGRTGNTYFYNVESPTDPILDATLVARWTLDGGGKDWTA